MQPSPEAQTAESQTGASASISQPPPAGLSTEPSAEPEDARSSEVQNLLKERSARLEAHKKDQDAKEKADRAAKAKARREAMEGTAGPEASKKSADMKYALMQKKRQQEAREERARILKRVEDDKAERREREALRKAQAKAKEGVVDQGSSSILKSSSSKSLSVECALQIRLFDGATIRSRFPSSGCLRADVRYALEQKSLPSPLSSRTHLFSEHSSMAPESRLSEGLTLTSGTRPWIDKQQDSMDVPYTFKHVLTPHPNKNISISEEEQSLESLELTPSATLILVPVKGYTSAYEASDAGLVSRGLSAGFGFVSSGVGIVAGALGGLLGGGAASANPANPATPSDETQDNPTPSTTPAINVRTLRDQERRPEDHQFYNGNAVSSQQTSKSSSLTPSSLILSRGEMRMIIRKIEIQRPRLRAILLLWTIASILFKLCSTAKGDDVVGQNGCKSSGSWRVTKISSVIEIGSTARALRVRIWAVDGACLL